MLLKRREKPQLKERVRVFLWPRRGWRRSTQYVVKRVLRLSGTPHVIALGCAAGVFASFTPFIGFHFIIGFLLAWAIGGNIIASAFGTFIGNPLTFPFIWASTYQLGLWLLGGKTAALPLQKAMGKIEGPLALLNSINELLPLIKPMTLGGIVLGIPVAIMCYFPARMAIDTYQARRRVRLSRRLAARPDQAEQAP